MGGGTFNGLMTKLKAELGQDQYALSKNNGDVLTVWMNRGYSILIRDQANFYFFGKREVKFPERARRILGLQGNSPVSWVSEVGTNTSHKLAGANFE